MKPVLTLLLILLTLQSFAQIISTWRGNTPGRESEWNCTSNWSNNRLPDEFTDVVIPVDISITYNYPVINTDSVEINSLSIWPGAVLKMKKGQLTILDPKRCNYSRIQVIGKGKLIEKETIPYPVEELTSVKMD